MKTLILPALLLTSLVLGGVACEKTTVKNEMGQELTLTAPADQSIKRGNTNKVNVAIDRDDFQGDVMIDFDDLPAGVKVAESDLKILSGNDSRDFTLMAEADAPLVEDHRVTVTAKAKNFKDAVQNFNVTVTAD